MTPHHAYHLHAYPLSHSHSVSHLPSNRHPPIGSFPYRSCGCATHWMGWLVRDPAIHWLALPMTGADCGSTQSAYASTVRRRLLNYGAGRLWLKVSPMVQCSRQHNPQTTLTRIYWLRERPHQKTTKKCTELTRLSVLKTPLLSPCWHTLLSSSISAPVPSPAIVVNAPLPAP